MKQKFLVGGAAIALMLGAAGVASAAPTTANSVAAFANCTEAAQAGQHDIPKGSPAYSAALDRDGDGVACDEKDRGTAAGTTADDADDTSLGADDGDGADESDGYDGQHPGQHPGKHDGKHNDGWQHDGEDDDQVSVVPEGGAPTGDGSTEDGTGWWLGGGLLAALAAAGVAFRGRLARLASPSGR
jgi:hypothetical protein